MLEKEDWGFEVDAPRHYDFILGSPGNEDIWFEARASDYAYQSEADEAEEDSDDKQGRDGQEAKPGSPVDGNLGNAPEEAAVQSKGCEMERSEQEQTEPAHPEFSMGKSPSNMVSSWDHVAKKNRPDTEKGILKDINKKRVGEDHVDSVQPPKKYPRNTNRVTRRNQSFLTSEELAMVKAKEEAAAEATRNKTQANRLSRILHGPIHPLSRSLKTLTTPADINLRTSARLRKTSKAELPSLDEQIPYKPLALRLKDFDRTPERFKPLPRGNANVPILPPKQEMVPTVPRGPRLRTEYRLRSRRVICADVAFKGPASVRATRRRRSTRKKAIAGSAKK